VECPWNLRSAALARSTTKNRKKTNCPAAATQLPTFKTLHAIFFTSVCSAAERNEAVNLRLELVKGRQPRDETRRHRREAARRARE
jgi:hypothetical protein